MIKFFPAAPVAGFLSLLTVLAIPSSPTSDSRREKVDSKPTDIGQAFEIPYQLTDTNHLLVRVRINGKGPFNFLVDSGAPTLYIATETANKAGLKPSNDHFWTPVNRLDLEGGATLANVKARIEDPFQLVGMNALGLPGTNIDGILGFTILARFRLEINPTRDSMTWTLLNYMPPDPPIPPRGNGQGREHPREVQALSALGPLAKGLALLIGKQPEEKPLLHGLLGFQWREERTAEGEVHIVVSFVLRDSPAHQAGLRAGDRVLRINSEPISCSESVQRTLAKVLAGDSVQLSIQRKGINTKEIHQLTITITASEGF